MKNLPVSVEIWITSADDSKLILALNNVAIIGLVTTFFPTLVGGGLTYGQVRYKFRGKTLIEALNILAYHLRCCFGAFESLIN